ncbi:hypothetical protein GCM10027614_82580 [Micromonospora vulcania]
MWLVRGPHRFPKPSCEAAGEAPNTRFLAWLQSVPVTTPELRQLRYFLVLAEELSFTGPPPA